MQDQLPLSVTELFILNLYFGSVTLVVGFVLLLWLLARNKKLMMNPAFSLMSLYSVMSPVLSFIIFSLFFKRIDVLFGPIHFQTAIAVLIVGFVLAKSFKLSLKKRKPNPELS